MQNLLIGQTRIDAMDRTCTAIQVLSWGSLGADKLDGEDAITFARDVNDAIYNSIQSNPKRFRGFAHLPTLQPQKAIEELNRAVNVFGFVGAMIVGMQGNKFLDDDLFSPLLSEFEKLDVPLYLHPGLPPDVVKNAYYYPTNNLAKDAAENLSIAGWGWHSEVGLHILRMCFSGIFDRHPNLKIIIGHNGEMLPMMMHRADSQAASLGMKRPISDMLRKNVWICISGILSMPAIKCAIDTFGIEHMCWAVDYPYVDEAIDNGKEFIRELRDNIGGNGFNALMYGNAQKILKRLH